MEPAKGLQQLGLSEYEARAYLALAAHPGATGYEAARQSGVPRAKIYEALDGLVAKGAAVTSVEGDKTRYHPVPHSTLLQRHLLQARQLADGLGPALDALSVPEPDAPLVTLKGYDTVLQRAGEIIASARSRVFLSGWPHEASALASYLQRAEAAGALVWPLVYGTVDLGLARTYHHAAPGSNRRLVDLRPTLIVVADHAEVLMADMLPGARATGLWTRNPAVTMIAAEFVKHDIFLVEMTRRFGHLVQDATAQMADLQQMWFR